MKYFNVTISCSVTWDNCVPATRYPFYLIFNRPRSCPSHSKFQQKFGKYSCITPLENHSTPGIIKFQLLQLFIIQQV